MFRDISLSEVAFLTFQAVVQVIIICFSGFFAAKTGVLNKIAQKNVSHLNMVLFTPAMIFSNLAPSLSLKKMFEIFIIPIFFVISTGISYVTAIFVGRYLNLDEYEGNFVTAMSVFGNSNSLPVSLTLTLAYTLPNLEWDDIEDDTPAKIASRGLLYLVIFQQIGQVLRWSWGYNSLLKRIPTRVNSYTDLEAAFRQETSVAGKNSNSTLTTVDNGFGDDSSNSIHSASPEPITVQSGLFGKVITTYKKFLSFMNPPLWAMFASVIVASITPVHDSFYIDNGFIQNTISSAIDQLGSVSIPLILIVLGSNLYPSSDTPPASPHYKRIVIGSLVSRMIIPPMILLPLITICVKLFPVSILDDPIFLIVAFLLTTAPPAIQLSQICQLNELYENEMAGVLFWGYAVLSLPTTIGIVAGALYVLKWAKA